MNKAVLDPLQEWRRQKLIALVGWPERGAVASFAQRYEINPSRLSHLLLGVKPMGEKAARALEQKTGRRYGWFDEGYDGGMQEEMQYILKEASNIMQQEMLRLMSGMSLEEQSELLSRARIAAKATPRQEGLHGNARKK